LQKLGLCTVAAAVQYLIKGMLLSSQKSYANNAVNVAKPNETSDGQRTDVVQ
jgi:hypothetical protein